MTQKNLISLVLLVVILAGWGLIFYDGDAAIIMGFATPVLTIAGFIFAIGAIRQKMQKALAWLLFTLHLLIILGYLVGFIYLAFYWNPRFF